MPFISALGIFISFKYDHSFLTFLDIYANSKCTSYSSPTLSKTQKPFLTFHKTRSYTHEIGCKTPHRRRGRFIVPVSWHNQIHTFISPHTHFPSPFRGCLRICGHDKSDPYSCERPANYMANTPQITTSTHEIPYFRTTKTILSHHEILYFYTAKTHFLHAKNLSATNWEGRKNVLLKSSL